MPHYDDDWRDTLIRLGGSIHQDEDPPLSDEDEAAQQAGIAQYLQMLDEMTGEEGAPVAEAALWSIHPISDYGIYEGVYGALSRFTPAVLGETAARALPKWLARNGDHPNIDAALMPVAYNDDTRAAFLAGAAAWSSRQRSTVTAAMKRWIRDSEQWEQVWDALGASTPASAREPIPTEWPEDWRRAAEAFRDDGRVNLAWTNERDLPTNFPRVFALLELRHGSRWREVGDFLNIFLRRPRELPVFAAALWALPEDRRSRILSALERSHPGVTERLRDAASKS